MEKTFHHMQRRKLERELSGVYEASASWKMLWTFLVMLLVLGFAAASVTDKGTFEFKFKLSSRDFSFLSLAAASTGFLLVYSLTRLVVIVRWALYWLLLAEALLYFWKRELNLWAKDTPSILVLSLFTVETLTFLVYALIHFFYPWFLASKTFHRYIGASSWWRLREVSSVSTLMATTCENQALLETEDYTETSLSHSEQPLVSSELGVYNRENSSQRLDLFSEEHCLTLGLTYNSAWFNHSRRNICTYRGPVNEAGEPHGFGHWIDDADTGEILTGYFEDGLPVGPFRSREFGTGHAFDCIFVGFSTCVEDRFGRSSLYSTQCAEPFVGLASVECSVAGSFFTHLPKVTLQKEIGSVRKALRKMITLNTTSKHDREVKISFNNRNNRVSVAGHVPGETDSLSKVEQIVIDVIKTPTASNTRKGSRKASFSALPTSSRERRPSSPTDSVQSLPRLNSLMFADSAEPPISTPEMTPRLMSATVPSSRSIGRSSELTEPLLDEFLPKYSLPGTPMSHRSTPYGALETYSAVHGQPLVNRQARLQVRDWTSVSKHHQEALIFFPGFNASMELCLKRLGQLISIGHFPGYIKPFVFLSIGHKIMTYIPAMWMTDTVEVVQSFKQLLTSLKAQRIRHIHVLAHSMGVQSAIGVLRNLEIQELFVSKAQPDGAIDTVDRNDQTKLDLCSITLLNGDYPLAAFVREEYRPLRLVCDLITVIGNLEDSALLWSELGNGVGILLDYYFETRIQPENLRSPVVYDDARFHCSFTEDELQGKDLFFGAQPCLGRKIHSLYAPKGAEELEQDVRKYYIDNFSPADRTLFQHKKFSRSERARPQYAERKWLDLDAIDTTVLVQNVHTLKHNYFNLNPVVVDDLKEIILTKKRAKERSSLLHREGNIFTYCQAPTFVVND